MVVKKSTKRTCITCTAKGVNKDKVPLWSKKDGLYSMLPKILNCEDTYNPNKQDLQSEEPEIVGTKVEAPLDIQETNRWVFYWAAEAGAALEGDLPEDPATSYGDESNRGLVKTDKDGHALLTLNCPKLYKEGDQLYPRHVHYTVLTDEDVWATNIGTLEIMCKLPLDVMKDIAKQKTYMILNALSQESYDEKHIPNSVLCHHESLEGLTKQKKDNILKRLLKDQLSEFPKLKEFVDKSGSIKEIPIIVYCAHSECEASSKLADHLYDCGYYNVMEYPGGLKEWFSEVDESLFDDADDTEDVKDEEEGDEEEETITSETNVNEDEEIIVYDGVEYIHRINEDGEYGDILTKEDLTEVGVYDGDDIVWNTIADYKKHLQLKGKHGKKIEEEEGDEEDAEEEEAEDEEENEEEEGGEEDAEEQDEAVEEGSEEDEEDEEDKGKLPKNREYLQSKTIKEIKQILEKLGQKRNTKSKQKLIDCIMNSKEDMTGGYKGGETYNDGLIYGGSSHTKLNKNFRGWGFSYF